MGALQRVEDDIRAGNLGLARQRLESYVSIKGYDPEVLARLGQICWDMKDKFNAGRHWLLSNADGTEVDEALAFFLCTANHNPGQVASFMLRSVRLGHLSQYPMAVQERLRRLNLADGMIKWLTPSNRVRQQSVWTMRIVTFVFLLILIASVGSCVVGLNTIAGWIG